MNIFNKFLECEISYLDLAEDFLDFAVNEVKIGKKIEGNEYTVELFDVDIFLIYCVFEHNNKRDYLQDAKFIDRNLLINEIENKIENIK